MVEPMSEPERPVDLTPDAEVPIARPAKGTRYNPTQPSAFQPQNVKHEPPKPRPGLACVVMIVTLFVMIGGFLAIGFALYKGFEILQKPKTNTSIQAPLHPIGTRT